MTADPQPDWDLTENQIDAVLMFPYCNKAEVRRGERKTHIPWPWLGGKPE